MSACTPHASRARRVAKESLENRVHSIDVATSVGGSVPKQEQCDKRAHRTSIVRGWEAERCLE